MGKYAVTDVYSHGEGKQTREQLSTSPLGNLESLEMGRATGSEAKKMAIALEDLKNLGSQQVECDTRSIF